MSRKSSKHPTVHPVEFMDPETLKGAEYNPRKINDHEFKKLADNLATFGFVENVVATKEDNEIIGGHQRVKAAIALIRGDYVPHNEKGQPIKVPFTKIPVVYMEGLTSFQRKTLNLSLNRISGEWDYDKLTVVIQDLYQSAQINIDNELSQIEKDLIATEKLLCTGFNADEISDFIVVDEPKEEKNDGKGPLPTQGVPKLTLEFTTKELRDLFKAYIASIAKEGETSGDSVARRLEIES
jgi:hypothetical protein